MNCRRKFLIEVCQYDCYNRIANFNSRYYTPEIVIWLSVDPMSDKYPSLSPYAYCALNPVILIDPDGREMTLVITGEAEAAKNNLQQSTTMKLDRDEKTGVVTTKDSPKTKNDERLFEVLRDPDHTAILDASSSNEVIHEGQIYGSYGGAFMGSDFTEENGVTKGTATNAVNPSKLRMIDLVFGRGHRGQSMLHEATEGYEAAKISASEKVKAGPAIQGITNPVYNRAHNAAVWQPEVAKPEIFDLVPKVQQSYKMMTR